MKFATLVRIEGATPEIVEALRAGRADVYASNAENVQAAAHSLPGSTILSGSEAKASGLVQKAIDAGALKGVRVAPD